YLRSTGSFCVRPNPNAYVRFTIAASEQLGATAGGAISIPDYAGRGFMMSDLLFAAPEAGPFVRGRARLALVPPRQFRQNQPFRVFYELYNLPAGGRYTTEITFTTEEPNPFARLFKGKRKTRVSFESEAAPGDVVQELRTLVPEVEPGRVLVTVTVSAAGASTSKSESIRILPNEEN
ncbi:MAG: hypothetical protein ACT443_14690, partial [Gemmatimonadota bacterium]